MAHRMTPDEVREFLTAGTRTGKLATVAADGRPLVVPIWFVVDDDGSVVFTCDGSSAKAAAMQRDARVSLCVDLEEPPYGFVQLQGSVELSVDADEMLRYATAIGARYMGTDRAEEFGRRNAVPGELLVRLRPGKVVAIGDIAG